MANKITGVTKAAIAGAVFGTAVGMVSVPRAKQSKKSRRNTVIKNTGSTLRTVGTAMLNVADMMTK